MLFENLSDRLQGIFKKLRGHGKLTEDDVNEAMREVRMALLEADVNFKVVKDFVKRVKERAVGQEVLDTLTAAQAVVKIVDEELTALMGGTESRLNISPNPPTVIMLVGLQGSGKTTSAGKLALMLKKQGKRPLLVADDIYRPAAIKQLEVIGGKVDVPVFSQGQEDAVAIARAAIAHSASHANDVVIIDTAGRLQIDETLMQELRDIKAEVKPHEILLVVDAMTGQEAVNVAEAFDASLGLDGVIMTKLDGDARGGAALGLRRTRCVRSHWLSSAQRYRRMSVPPSVVVHLEHCAWHSARSPPPAGASCLTPRPYDIALIIGSKVCQGRASRRNRIWNPSAAASMTTTSTSRAESDLVTTSIVWAAPRRLGAPQGTNQITRR